MKTKIKKILFFFILSYFLIPIYSQNMNSGENLMREDKIVSLTDTNKIETYNYDNPLNKKSFSQMKFYYYPYFNELRIEFKCAQSIYDNGEVIITIRDRLLEFIAFKGYYHYSRLQKDIIGYTKNDNDEIIVNYFVQVKIFK